MKKIIIALFILLLSIVGCVKQNPNKITDDQALIAIKNYCYANIPDLKEMEKSNNYTINWEVVSSDEKEIVVLFRSYTGALVRYYIDVVSGDTYVTEFVEGIMDKEERTGESFNIKDYK